MTLSQKSLLRWVSTLKFKIVAIAVVTGVVSALGTTQIVLSTTPGRARTPAAPQRRRRQ